MSDSRSHIVVVLGMHRSGTSALTRALLCMGVDLGTCLMKPMPGVNDKGFFEDVECNDLNERILSALGSAWHSLAPIPPQLFLRPDIQSFAAEAEALLQKRFENAPLFGMKDPRLCVLLPFWQQIFRTLHLKASYLVSIRNPLSIAKSIAKRDGFHALQSYYLWLNHVMSALHSLEGEALLVTDYDRMLDNPEREVQRIARFLELSIEPAQLVEYRKGFLDASLRHSRFTHDELASVAEVPESVVALHALLSELAVETTDIEWGGALATIADRWSELAPALTHMQSLRTQCDQSAARLAEQERQIVELRQEAAEHGARVRVLEQELVRGEQQETVLKRELEALRTKYLQASELCGRCESALSDMHQLLTSRSWRATKPLRTVAGYCRKVRRGIPAFRARRPPHVTLYERLKRRGEAAPERVEFMFIAEKGVLEEQAVLLAESIGLFTEEYARSPITVVSPRADRRPSGRALRRFEELGMNYIPLDVHSPCPEYGTTFRILASAFVEKTSRADILVVLDSDSIFIRKPRLALNGAAAAARPVDVKGMCTTGARDAMDPYWRKLCRCCGVDYDRLPYVSTAVDRLRVKASYNGGFIAARRAADIFQRTEDYFLRSYRLGLRPHENIKTELRAGHGIVSSKGLQYWGSAQACLSLAVWGAGLTVETLSPTHNFPFHMLENALASLPAGTGENLVHLHYHHLFFPTAEAQHVFDSRISLPDGVKSWLVRKLRFADAAAGGLSRKLVNF